MNGNNPNDTEYDTTILTIDWELDNFLLTSITGYREQEEDTYSEYDASSAPFLALDFYQEYDQFSQEFRLTSDFSDKFEFVAGLYYWNSEYSQNWYTHDLFFVLDVIGGIVPGIPGGAGFTPSTVAYSAQEQETTSYAAFISADWHVTDKWTVTAGLRYTDEEKDFVGSNAVYFNLGDTAPPLSLTPLQNDWSELSPKLSTSYELTDDILLFASYAEGFKSGGYFGRNTDFENTESYDPEFVDSFEVGMKSAWMDNRLIFNTALFYSDYEDKQEEVLVETGPGQVATNVVNAAVMEIKGLDVEVIAQLTEAWSLRASYGYLDAEYDEFLGDLNGDGIKTDNSGFIPRNVPENTFGLSSSYTVPIGSGDFSAYVAYRYQDEIETILNNDPLGHIDALENLDVTLTYGWDNYRVTAFGRNLTDEVYARRVRIEPLVTFGQWTQGRNYGLEFALTF